MKWIAPLWSQARTILVQSAKHTRVYTIPFVFEEEWNATHWVVKVEKDGVRLVGIDGMAKPLTCPDSQKTIPLGKSAE
jgi:hypothetical protein